MPRRSSPSLFAISPTTKLALSAAFLTMIAGCRAEPPIKEDDTGPLAEDCDSTLDLSGTATVQSYTSSGTVRLNLRVDQFNAGPAAGAQHVTFELGELRAVMSRLVGGTYQPPAPVALAYGPAPIALWAPQSPRPLFAGEWTLPVGRLLGIDAVVSSMVVTDSAGVDHDVVFGAQRNAVGVLAFRAPPGTPAMEITTGTLKGWEMVLPAGATGALHAEPDGRYRLDPGLPGNAAQFTRPFEFSNHRLIVRYAAGTTPSAIAAFEAQQGAEEVWSSFTGMRAIEFTGTDWYEISERYLHFRASQIVEFVSLDPIVRAAGHDTTYVDDTWYDDEQGWMWDARVAPSDDASTDYAWLYSQGSREVVIGFIDGGLDYNHPDLVNNLYVNVDEFPAGLVDTCGLDPDALGLTIDEALDFDEDGVFTLHDLNGDLADDTLRNDTLDLLDLCGYPVSATASTAAYDYDSTLVQADDFLETFADGIDDDSNGFADDFFGANFRSVQTECIDGTWPAATCNPWDVNPDDRCDTSLAHCDETWGIQHGTQMAGLAAAEGDNARTVAGVSMQARILEARADATDPATILTFSAAMEAADYLIEEGAHIIVCPWGAVLDIPPECAEDFSAEVAAELEARPETLFVFSAGNEGVDCDDEDIMCFPAEAAADNMVSVGATLHTTTTNSGAGAVGGELEGFASFSNRGENTIELAVPGGAELPSTANGFADWGYAQYSAGVRSYTQGTSASAAVTGGAAALRLAACGDPVDGAALATAILDTARDRSADLVCGTGPCVTGGLFLDAGELVGSCSP